jgi:hypothetical protein
MRYMRNLYNILIVNFKYGHAEDVNVNWTTRITSTIYVKDDTFEYVY